MELGFTHCAPSSILLLPSLVLKPLEGTKPSRLAGLPTSQKTRSQSGTSRGRNLCCENWKTHSRTHARRSTKYSCTKYLSLLYCASIAPDMLSQRLGLRRLDVDDESKLIRPLLGLLAEHSLDFHSTFRRLAYFRPHIATPTAEDGKTPELDEFIGSLMALTPDPQMVDAFKAKADWKAWLGRYVERIESERALWDSAEGATVDADAQREQAMRSANPRFVLRQWVLEEVIKRVEEDPKRGRRVLGKVLQVCVHSSCSWVSRGRWYSRMSASMISWHIFTMPGSPLSSSTAIYPQRTFLTSHIYGTA